MIIKFAKLAIIESLAVSAIRTPWPSEDDFYFGLHQRTHLALSSKEFKDFPADEKKMLERINDEHIKEDVNGMRERTEADVNATRQRITLQAAWGKMDGNESMPLKPRKNLETKLTVHLVPHTHDDVGWVKTVDQYFTGANGRISHASVRLILDEVIDNLKDDPNRKFTYVEMKFFTMWYKKQTPEIKELTKKLVKSGQLEITQGGWSATDEACANFEDMILNMQKGHAFLKKEFGVRPRVGW